jgi:hypothetical protein
MDWKLYAEQLLEEYNMCCQARQKHGAVDVQLEKDSVAKWATLVATQKQWGTENEIAEACYQLEPRLKKLKEMLVIEILQNGPIQQ